MSSPGTSFPDQQTSIPDKLYFRIGEVAQLAGVEPYVLRFWEGEFPQLAPKKSGTGHRLYRRKDVELILEVKRLLYEKRYTIEGARLHFDQSKKKGGSKAGSSAGAAKAAAAAASASSAPPPEAPPMQPMLFGAPLEATPPPGLAEIKRELLDILKIINKRQPPTVR
ncbi:MAG: MerR family transcriptional regulator [Bryobacterales bacterium]|nr:MerR family transcriptional regulator [Bryobacterales bacterium]